MAKNRIDIELAKQIALIGFSINDMENWYHHAFTKSWRVSDKARKKYGDLSDDGFYELTKDGGGKLKWREIYTNDWAISSHYPLPEQEFYLSPTIYEVQTFLRKTYKKHITIYSKSQESWQYRITSPGQDLIDGDFSEDFAEYEDALYDAITYITKQLIKKQH